MVLQPRTRAAMPQQVSRVMNLRMEALRVSAQLAHVGKPASNGGGGGHGGAHQVGTPTGALTAFEVAVGGGGTTLARLQPVGVHGQAHGATRLAPFKACRLEDLVQPFRSEERRVGKE